MLTWLEGTALAAWIRESPSIWAYPTILTAHTVGLSVVVGLSTVVALRLVGFARRIPLGDLSRVFGALVAAFVLNAVTGVLLFIADATMKAGQPILYIKLALILAASWYTWRMRSIVRLHASDNATIEIGQGRVAAWASLACWAAAITAGRLMAYL